MRPLAAVGEAHEAETPGAARLAVDHDHLKDYREK